MQTIIDSSISYIYAKQLLIDVNNKIKRTIYKTRNNLKYFSAAGYCEVNVGYLDGKAVERVIIILRGIGCEWTNREDGGCVMCGHIVGSTKGQYINPKYLQIQFDSSFSKYDFSKYPILCLYNGGSFLNENEIPGDLRRNIFQKIAAEKNIKRLIIESRPEYITNAILDEIEKIFTSTVVEIGVGFETANNQLRNLVLNKGVSNDDLIKVGHKFKYRKNIKLLAYILVKPPFLTSSEAIQDAVNSIQFAYNIGANIVSLEAVSIQHLTLVSFLYEIGKYKPTWIWSLFEIVKQTFNLGIEIRIGGFEFFPIPKEFTSNCHVCNEKMINVIQEFNKHQNISILENLKCENNCDLLWKEELKEINNDDLQTRIISTLDNIIVDLDLKSLQEPNN